MILALLVSLAFICLGAGVAVAADDKAAGKVIDSKDGYTVTAGKSDSSPFVIMTISGFVVQGQTCWHYNIVSGYYTSLNVDLNWGNPSNSLRLKVYSPDGHTFGPYYDSSDGSINGRINIYIRNSNGIAQGAWVYEVYGYSVSGTQSYTI